MEKKAVSGIMLTLVLISMLTMAFNIQPVKATGTIYIRADGSIDPPTANITSVDNVTYTFTGNNCDSIVVERDNIVVDGAGYMVQGTGSGRGIDLSGRSNVTVKNTQIIAFDYGIYLDGSGNTLSGNNITNNDYGILLDDTASNNAINANNIANSVYGIWLWVSSYNIISRNEITDNERGIYFYGSSRNTINANNIRNNEHGVYLRRHAIHPTLKSEDNKIFHNNFINNIHQVYSDDILTVNVWDDGYPSGGNHWSDYTDVDLHSGPYQNETGSDGIWDHPYVIDENNQDRYPFVSPPIELIFRPPYAMGDGGLGFADEFGTGKALYYSYAFPYDGFGKIGVGAHVFPGGGYAWAEADFILGDSWRSSFSGAHRILASFNIDGFMGILYASGWKYGKGFSMAILKARLSVYDKTEMAEVLQEDLVIFEAKLKWSLLPIRWKRELYRDTPFSIAGYVYLEEGHEYEWTFRMHMGGYAIVALVGAGIAKGDTTAYLNEVHIQPEGLYYE